MFDRHRAEITVMQFTGRSLPVHQFVAVPCDFLPCLILSAKPAYAISSHNWPSECVTSAVFGMACLAGLEVNIQQKDLFKNS